MTNEPVLPEDLDLNEIFIGRERQLNDFRVYLESWKHLITTSSFSPLTMPPSPINKIQSFFVLLYGRGGFGKSTLLSRYRQIALENSHGLLVSNIVDWETALQDRRTLFNVTDRENIDAYQYFNLIYTRLATALGKQRKEFSEYRASEREVEKARKKAYEELEQLQLNEQFSWLDGIGLARDAILALLSVVTPDGISIMINNEVVRDATGEAINTGAKVGREQWLRLRAHLEARLGKDLSDYLDAPLQLGLALGRDLARFAERRPILILFDTYEEIDEGDKLLQICMGAAGARVGWIISGRDNLWAGLTQRLRNTDAEYGYRELVYPNRSIAIDFIADGVGDFTPSDIEEYFKQICQKTNIPWPARDSLRNALRVLEVTRGVPLAVRIVASLYLEKPDLALITEDIDSRREIIDQMVERYLRHTRANPADRAKMYGLALLRRIEKPVEQSSMTAIALDISQGLEAELSRLHRRYGFIFTQHGQPTLHQEVRHFLRLWLLQNRNNSEVLSVIKRLHEAVTTRITDWERQHSYRSLHQRMADKQWVQLYLDYTELEFWLDPTRGVRSLLPFMCAASIYQREANREACQVGNFFEAIISKPALTHWRWADQCLIFGDSLNPLRDEFTSLRELVKLAGNQEISFAPPLPGYQAELEAALWWRMGEAYHTKDIKETVLLYRKARHRLPQEADLKKALDDAVRKQITIPGATYTVSDYLQQGRNRVLNNDPQNAIKDFNSALELDEECIQAYIERGTAYLSLNKPELAINDFEQALKLDPDNVVTLRKRGEAYEVLKDLERAILDFERALKLDPGNKLTEDKLRDLRKKMEERKKRQKIAAHTSPTPKKRRLLVIAGSILVILLIIGSVLFAQQLSLPPQLTLLSTNSSHTAAVQGVAWSPNGKYIADASYDKEVHILDANSGRLLIACTGHAANVWRVAWSPDSKYIATVGEDKAMRIWDAQNCAQIFVGAQENIARGVAWSPDGSLVATSNLSGIIKIWNFPQRKLERRFIAHPDGAYGIAWSHDGRYLAVGNENNTADIWDVASQRIIFTYQAHRTSVYALAWSKDDRYIASGSSDNSLQVWNAQNGSNLFSPREGFHDSVWGVAWSPDGQYIATASKDGSLHVYDARDGHIVALYQGNAQDFMSSVAWAPDSKRLVTGNFDKTTRIWQL